MSRKGPSRRGSELTQADSGNLRHWAESNPAKTTSHVFYVYSGLGGKQRGIGHNNNPAHNRMDAALIGVTAWLQAGNRIGSARFDGAGIECAPAAVFKTSIMGHGMVGRGRIIPPNGGADSHGDGSGHVIGRTAVHHDVSCRWNR
ncbi:MAG: hypothetical protein K0S45_316 [Nitrospira sp.]|nr:hypothetical protein [Nitrospira sp.]